MDALKAARLLADTLDVTTMGRRKQLRWWQITLGFLLIAILGGGLGLLVGVVMLSVRALVDPPLSYFAVLPAALIVMIVYFKFVWLPVWTLRFPTQQK